MSNTSAKRSVGAQPKASISSIPSSSPVTNPEEYIHSSLIHEVYLYNDLKNDFPKFWGRTGIAEGGFDYFYQGLKELALDIKTITSKKLDHSQTLTEVIIPTLAALGWNTSKETTLGKNITVVSSSGDEIAIKPTALLFATESDATAFKNHYKNSATPLKDFNQIPVATSYFASWSEQRNGRYEKSREQFGKFGDLFSNFSTDEQAYNYLELLGSEWSFSTDGHSWRLIKKSAFQTDHTKYFEFNLWAFLNALHSPRPHEEDALIEISKYFYWFFSKESHHRSKPNQIGVTWERSQKYTNTLEDDLRGRFVAAMSVGVNSLWNNSKEKGLHLSIPQIQGITESLIFNSLFIRSCESRRVLVLHPNYRPVSLHNLVSKLRDVHPTDQTLNETTITRLQTIFNKNISDDGTELFDYMINLFDLTNDSEKKSRTFGFAIEGFKENIFSPQEWASLKKAKIDNLSISKVFTLLFYFDQSVQIPFNLITPQQFGSIFESFLEFKLSPAPKTQYLIRRIRKIKSSENKAADISWTSETKSSDEVIYTAKRGSLYFRSDNSDRKVSGTYFTPDHVVDLIVKETLTPICKDKSPEEILKVRVCDPAMGSGHFLISALRFLTKEYIKASSDKTSNTGTIKRQILHNCIFGADKEPRAAKLSKLALWLETAEPGKELEHLDDQIKATNSLCDESIWKNDWGFLKKGLDAVVGNPPYLGEKGNKAVFQEISQQWLGKRFYQGKMDLLYFFFHLGLDILKDGGRLGYITTNYFTTALGAKNLRHDFFNRSNIDLLFNLNELKVFGEAAGQHNMITLLTKTTTKSTTRVINSSEIGKCTPSTLSNIYNGKSKKTSYSSIKETELFDGEEMYIRFQNGTSTSSKSNFNAIIETIKKEKLLLGNLYNISTGIQTGADKVSQNHIKKYKMKNVNKGDGIFVLSKSEIASLSIPEKESKRLVKPFFKNSDISKFTASSKTNEYLLYLDKRQFEISTLSKGVQKHIDKFRSIIDGSVCSPPYLHRPREKDIFTGPKIVVPQRSKLNTFGYNEGEWYASCDVYFITKTKDSPTELPYILALLNSKLYFVWLYLMGKRKGEALELYQTPLSEIPIKIADEKIQKKIVKLSENLIHSFDSYSWDALNNTIYDMFGVTQNDRAAINQFYADRVKTDETEDNDQNEEMTA